MKKLVLFAMIILFAMNMYGQANILKTPNFNFRTIKKGYTGDWAGSQTDTNLNNGINYNALMDEILWSKIFNSTFSPTQTFRDSIGGMLKLHTIIKGDSIFGRVFVRSTDTTLVFWNGSWKIIKDLR